VSRAKTAAMIEIPFELLARMGRRNCVLDGGSAVLRDVAMATNFGTQFPITGFLGYNIGCMIILIQLLIFVDFYQLLLASDCCNAPMVEL